MRRRIASIALAALGLVIVCTLGWFALLKGVNYALRKEYGFQGDIVVGGQTIIDAISCGFRGGPGGIWVGRTVQALGGSYERIAVDGQEEPSNREYWLVHLNGKRIKIGWEGQPDSIGPVDVDAHVVITGGDFSGGDMKLSVEKAMEVLRVGYPNAKAGPLLEFDFNRAICKWELVL